jgi:plasmid stabilization system protein ParE
MIVRFTPRALAEARRVRRWWRQHRPAAAEVFDRELNAAVALIQSSPTIGGVYPTASDLGIEIRRLLMARTENHLYYTLHEDALVILSIWGAPRERGPGL